MQQQRLLGAWESGFRSAHDMLHGTMLVVSKANFVGVYDLKMIKQVFELLFKQHPLLRATIEIRGYNSYFVLNADFEDIPIHEISYPKSWQEQFEVEIHQPLNSQQHLWRITLAKNSKGFDIFIVMHHAMADALSSVNLLDQFMKIYSALLCNKIPNISIRKFFRNIESYLKESNNWQTFAKNYFELDQASIDKIPYENNAPIVERRSRSQFLKLDCNTVEQILEKV